MSQSTDSDIIFRKRQNSRKSTRFVEDQQSSEIIDHSEMAEGDFDPLFHEIFGTGDEYSYIYNKETVTENILENQKDNTNVSNLADCYKYVSGFLKGYNTLFRGVDLEIVKLLLNGNTPEYIAFHLGKLTVKELYFIKDLIEDYKNNIYINLDSEPKITGLLSCYEYISNLNLLEGVYLPEGKIEIPFNILNNSNRYNNDTNGYNIYGLESNIDTIDHNIDHNIDDASKNLIFKHFKKTISKIASNPIFIKRVAYSFISNLLEPENISHSLAALQKLYCTGQNDINDQIRKLIIQKAFEIVNINKNDLEKQYLKQGILEGPGGLQELVDLIISLRGRNGSYAGVYYDKNLFSVVKIDLFGNFLESAIFKENDLFELQSFLTGIDNICITSSSPSVKFILQNTPLNFLYVPKKLSFFDDFKDLSIPYNISLLVQNPVLYFTRLWYCLVNNLNNKNLSNYRSNDIKMLERAISIACATSKLDWSDTLSHKFGFMIFNLLKIDISDPYFNFKRLDELESLKQVFNITAFNNICTFFNSLSSEYPLDHTFIHPNNYSMAIILFKGAYHSLYSIGHESVLGKVQIDLNKDIDKIIELFINKPDILISYHTSRVEGDDDMNMLANLKQILLRENEIFFSGAADDQIFYDLVPLLEEGKIYSGTISKIGTDFYIVLVDNTSVFIKKSTELVLNQLVKVEITESNTSMLNYSGNLVLEEISKPDLFRSHPFFKDMSYDVLERYMKDTETPFLIRPSITAGCCSVVCRLVDGIFTSYRLKEVLDINGNVQYEFKDRYYSSIDLFIDQYIRNVYKTVTNIVSFKYYFSSLEEALKYVNTSGEFIRYAIVFSRDSPGYIEFLLGGKRIFSKIDGERLVLKDLTFFSVEELVRFIKSHITSL